MKKMFKKSIAMLIAVLMVISTMPFTALTAFAADSVGEITGAVKYSSVIFTHGTNTVSTDYNYLMTGTQIAAGDVKSATDCKTTVTTASGVTINSVSCVEDSSASLSVKNGLLTGSFSSNKDDQTVTLKTDVTYNGNVYTQYNKLYVDTIPVPAHAAGMSQRYYGVFNPLKSINAYSQTLKGSLGQTSGNGSASDNGVKANAKELFEPGTTVRYDNNNDQNHWRLTHNITIDKVAGYTGYANSGGSGRGTTTLTTTAPTGYYYFDKSTNDNYGFASQGNGKYTFELVTIPFRIVTGDNANSGSVNLDTHTITGNNFTQSDPYTTWSYNNSTGIPSVEKFTNVITGDASSLTSGTMTGTYELRFATNNSDGVWAVNITKSSWNVYVADKTVARNPYNTANSNIKVSTVYSADSWNNYKNALLDDEQFLSNYKNVALGTVQATATDKGSALTTALNNLAYNYTFKRTNGESRVIVAKSYDSALAAANLGFAPTAATEKTYKDNNKHAWTTYAWPESIASGVYEVTEVPTENTEDCNYGEEQTEVIKNATCNEAGSKKVTKTCTVCGHVDERTEVIDPTGHTPGEAKEENRVEATCGKDGSYYKVIYCTVCNAEISREKVTIPATGNHTYGAAQQYNETQHKYVCEVCGDEKLEEHNFVDGKCTECGYSALNMDAYNAAHNDAVLTMAETDKYTQDSIAAYKSAVVAASAKIDSATTQAEVDAITSEIISAKNLLAKARITITFVVENEDDSTKSTKHTETYDWGTTVPCDTKSTCVSKWTIDVNGATSNMATTATAIDHIATNDATITAYVSNEESDSVKYSKVTFLGKSSAVVGIYYVEVGKTVAATDLMKEAPAVPFYTASGWDKSEIFADGSDITVRATYTAKDVAENKCNVHFNGTDKLYAYDSYVYLFSADKSKKYAMYADEAGTELITYLGGVDFSVPRRDDIYIKEVTDTSAMTATIGFSGFYKQDSKTSFNVKFWLPEGATLIETGVDLTATFPNGTVKTAHDRATKFNARNEYTYTATFGTGNKSIEFKPYLTYMKDGKKATVYGTSQTVEY